MVLITIRMNIKKLWAFKSKYLKECTAELKFKTFIYLSTHMILFILCNYYFFCFWFIFLCVWFSYIYFFVGKFHSHNQFSNPVLSYWVLLYLFNSFIEMSSNYIHQSFWKGKNIVVYSVSFASDSLLKFLLLSVPMCC